jgi:hypothetical protein
MGEVGCEIIDGDDERGSGDGRQQDEKGVQNKPAFIQVPGNEEIEVEVNGQGLTHHINKVLDGKRKVEQIVGGLYWVTDGDRPQQVIISEPKRKMVELYSG